MLCTIVHSQLLLSRAVVKGYGPIYQ